MYSEKFLKITTKLLRSPFPVMLETFFTRKNIQRTLGYTKGTKGALRGHLRT